MDPSNNGDNPSKSAPCFKATLVTSAGIFSGDKPLQTTLPQLLSQILTIFVATRATHALLRPLGIPQPVSHVTAGVILGHSFLSRNDTFRNLVFPLKGWVALNMIALLSLSLFIFVIGVKTDLSLVRKSGKKALAIATVTTVLPHFSVLLVARLAAISFEDDMVTRLGSRWANTSNIVLACLLQEFNLLTSKLGRLAMSATLISDVAKLLVTSVYTAVKESSLMKSPVAGLLSFGAIVVFLAVIIFVARPLVLWLIHRMPEGGVMGDAYFMTMMLLVIALALAGELIGHHSVIGPLLLGLVLPGGPPLGTTLVERLERVLSGLFIPAYFVISGFKTNIVAALSGGRATGYMLLLIIVSVVTKFVGLLVVCLLNRMPVKEALVLTLMMSCKGIMDWHYYNIWQESNMVTDGQYTVHVLAAVFVGGVSSALVKYLYKPSMPYLAYRRTIEHSQRNDELRILVCVHHSENAAPLITFLEISHPEPEAPICVYLLHLSPLVGRNAAVLSPYKLVKRRRGSFKSSSSPETDHIVNAFRFLERHNVGGFNLLPFVSIAPYNTMHDDVCSVALDKKVTIVVLPFHKYFDPSGTVESLNPAIQAMNLKVLIYAPCSVAILIDHGLSGVCSFSQELFYRVAVFFLGGADDREALAYAIRIADNPKVGLSVVRFLLAEDVLPDDPPTREELLDNDAVEEFQAECMGMGNNRVEYREELVQDGPDTMAVIREMCEGFSLLIVGRRVGVKSPMTMGLEMWSEYPELGVVGDILASTDFGGKVSTLVVQQQKWIGVGQGLQRRRPGTN